MKKQPLPTIIAIVITCIFVSSALTTQRNDPHSLLNQKVPAIDAVTVDGQRIDSNYFKGKVTLISFMFIGCVPCMKEAPVLNQLYKEVSHDTLQMLCVAPHTAIQMADYNSKENNRLSLLRKANGVEPIPYPVIAECTTTKEGRAPNVLGPECNTLSAQFFVSGYPATLLVDHNGIVRKVYEGFSTDSSYAAKFKSRIKMAIRDIY